MKFLRKPLAIGVEEGLDSQDSSVPFREPSRRPVYSDGKLNMRDAGEIRTQVEHRCGGCEVTTEPTTVAATGSHVEPGNAGLGRVARQIALHYRSEKRKEFVGQALACLIDAWHSE